MTGSTRAWTDAALSRVSSPAGFDVIVTGDDVVASKPAPDPYVHALKMLGLDPSEALAVEDSPTGCAAAVAAGMQCVVVPSGKYVAADFCDAALVASSLTDVSLDRSLLPA